MVLGENRQRSSKGDWNDSYSASTDEDEDCISSKCNESQYDAIITLEQRVEELSQLVTAKDEEKDV
eukprot:scaffold37609_cov23-Cyclotella_meneghiniana.AAC.1